MGHDEDSLEGGGTLGPTSRTPELVKERYTPPSSPVCACVYYLLCDRAQDDGHGMQVDVATAIPTASCETQSLQYFETRIAQDVIRVYSTKRIAQELLVC